MKSNLRIILCVLSVLSLCAAGSAQIVIEPEVATDTIDVFKPVVQSDKSRTIALAGSILLPGLGHAYLGKDNAAMAFFTSEALMVFGAFFAERTSKKLFGDSRAYAYTYADLGGGAGTDEFFWKAVGSFMDAAEYNRVMELNGTDDDKLLDPNLAWRWADKSYMDHYGQLRQNATRFHIASRFFLAGMALNRVIAFVQIRHSLRNRSIALQGVQMRPALAVSSGGATFSMLGTF